MRLRHVIIFALTIAVGLWVAYGIGLAIGVLSETAGWFAFCVLSIAWTVSGAFYMRTRLRAEREVQNVVTELKEKYRKQEL